MAFMDFLTPQRLKMGTQAVGAFTEHFTANIQADMEEAAQAHRNAMMQLSAAGQQNTVTLTETALQDQSQRDSMGLQQAALRDQGSAAVSAAAAGVAGNSVQQTVLGLKRSALQAQDARMRNLGSALRTQAQERKNIQLAAITGQDTSVISRPSIASTMLGLGVSLIDTYDANQPKGSRTTDKDVSAWDVWKGL